jgi:hypothetical protein
MDDFVTDSIKYGALFLAALGAVVTVVSVAIAVPFFFGLFLAMCAAGFVAGAVINTVVILSRKLKWRRSASKAES